MPRLLLIALSFLFSVQQSLASGLVKADGPFFKDSAGRILLLRGVNLSAAAKTPPFEHLTDNRQLDWIRDFGLNTIRLLFIWEAFETEKGVINQSYLDRLGEIVEEASARGIYTVIDFHSDGFSRYILNGCGSGFPKWTIPAPVQTVDNPLNDGSCAGWALSNVFEHITGGDVIRMTNAFYADTNGIRTRYLEIWKTLAQFFKKYPMVIGYDLLNEPIGDEISQIAPLYEDAAKVIRREDPDSILFVEPGIFTVGNMFFSKLPKPGFSNFAYSPHSYDVSALGIRAWVTGTYFTDRDVEKLSEQSSNWNAPVFIGEFGAHAQGFNLEPYMEYFYEQYDRFAFSGAQWNLSPSWNEERKDGWNSEDLSIADPRGVPRSNFSVRPYPHAVAGKLISFKFKKEKGELDIRWKHDPKLGKTVISYPKKFLSPKGKIKIIKSFDGLSCEPNSENLQIICESPFPYEFFIRVYGKR